MPHRAWRCVPVLFTLPALFGACAPSVPHLASPAARDAGGEVGLGDGAAGPPAQGPAEGGGPIKTDVRAPPASGGDATAETGSETRAATVADARDASGDGASREMPVANGPAPVEPRPGELTIDELLVNPAGSDLGREWIEITNATGLALNLRTLHLADAASEVAVDAGVIAAGGILVLGQSIEPSKNGGAQVAVMYGTAISLNNDGDSISLCLGPCADGTILDRVSWGSDLGPLYDGHALVRRAPGSDSFCPADQPFGAAGSFGTPGSANPPCPP
jgi:hypothetical protein